MTMDTRFTVPDNMLAEAWYVLVPYTLTPESKFLNVDPTWRDWYYTSPRDLFYHWNNNHACFGTSVVVADTFPAAPGQIFDVPVSILEDDVVETDNLGRSTPNGFKRHPISNVTIKNCGGYFGRLHAFCIAFHLCMLHRSRATCACASLAVYYLKPLPATFSYLASSGNTNTVVPRYCFYSLVPSGFNPALTYNIQPTYTSTGTPSSALTPIQTNSYAGDAVDPCFHYSAISDPWRELNRIVPPPEPTLSSFLGWVRFVASDYVFLPSRSNPYDTSLCNFKTALELYGEHPLNAGDVVKLALIDNCYHGLLNTQVTVKNCGMYFGTSAPDAFALAVCTPRIYCTALFFRSLLHSRTLRPAPFYFCHEYRTLRLTSGGVRVYYN